MFLKEELFHIFYFQITSEIVKVSSNYKIQKL